MNVHAGTPLQLLMRDRMIALGTDGKPLSLREVSVRSGRRGGTYRVSKMSASNILRGKTIRLQGDTVIGLAKALEVPEDQIRAAIEQSVSITMELPEKLKKLSPDGWADLLEFGDFLLAREGKETR